MSRFGPHLREEDSNLPYFYSAYFYSAVWLENSSILVRRCGSLFHDSRGLIIVGRIIVVGGSVRKMIMRAQSLGFFHTHTNQVMNEPWRFLPNRSQRGKIQILDTLFPSRKRCEAGGLLLKNLGMGRPVGMNQYDREIVVARESSI